MKDSEKSKEQLIEELSVIKKRIVSLEPDRRKQLRVENERKSLQRLLNKLTGPLNMRDLGKTIAVEARLFFLYDAFWITYYDEKNEEVNTIYREDTPVGSDIAVEYSEDNLTPENFKGTRAFSGKSTLINRSEEMLQSDMEPFGDNRRISRSLMFVPILWSGSTIGILSVQSYTKNRYCEDDLEFLKSFAAHCGGSIARVKAEKELHLLGHMVESTSEMISITDLEDKFIFINTAFCEKYGYSKEEIIGKHVTLIVSPQNSKEHLNNILKETRKGKWEGRVLNLSKDGTEFTIELSTSQINDEEGKVIGLVGVAKDITQQLRVENSYMKSESKLQSIFSAMDDVVFLFDKKQRFTYYHSPRKAFFNSSGDLLGKKHGDVLPWHVDMLFKSAFSRSQNGEVVEYEYSLESREDEKWYSAKLSPLFIGGLFQGAVSVVRDITDRKKFEAENIRHRVELEKMKMVHQAVLRSTPHGLCIFDAGWTITYANRSMTNILNPDSDGSEALLGINFKNLFETGKDFEEYSDSALKSIRTIGMDVREMQLCRVNGDAFWCEVSIVRLDPTETLSGYVATITDITKRKAAEEKLERAALYDSLTDLPNRSLFMDRLGRCFERARRVENYRFAVLYMDLDRFKTVNDSLGHQIGDDLLRGVARRFEKCTRFADTVARWGGDEFTVLVDNIESNEDVTNVADRLFEALSEPFQLEGMIFYTSASIGIAFSSSHYTQPQFLLRDADNAMYRAKEEGGDRYVLFDKAMHDLVLDQLTVESSLKNAINKNEFLIHYQPIISIESGHIHGVEALVRWEHPVKGLIYPDRFIPIAEDTGFIIIIGEWVLREACRQMVSWNSRYKLPDDFSLSINISARQYLNPGFVDLIRTILNETCIESGRLCLEVTESLILGSMGNIQDVFKSLKALGIQLHLDDFGTGYSSLSYLHRFPIDTLKIDRSFIIEMGSVTESYEIVRSILSLAQSLNVNVIAEGVSNQKQLSLLKELKCTYAQGDFFYPPISCEELEKIIRNYESKPKKD
jgi:diguanylate cyclase (GGDEF)-like protein/PAS domain S-box-containing protein